MPTLYILLRVSFFSVPHPPDVLPTPATDLLDKIHQNAGKTDLKLAVFWGTPIASILNNHTYSSLTVVIDLAFIYKCFFLFFKLAAELFKQSFKELRLEE